MASTRLLDSLAGHKEWLLVDGVGGYALGCCDSKQRRRYHSILTVAALPPIRRILMLGFIEEHLVLGNEEIPLFDEVDATRDFEAGLPSSLTWHCTAKTGNEVVKISREISLRPGGGSHLTYRLHGQLPTGARLVLRPVLYQRCHHRTLGLDAFPHIIELPAKDSESSWALKTTLLNFEQVHFALSGGAAALRTTPKKFLITYETEIERGFEHEEEVESDFEFEISLPSHIKDATVTLETNVGAKLDSPSSSPKRFLPSRTAPCPFPDDRELWNWMLDMVEASNDFVARGKTHSMILAGYPWFGAWARDTFMSLNAFCLLTKRYSEARSILDFFASNIEKGLVPNRFHMAPERMSFARDFGSVDSTPWFLFAAAQYAEKSHDRDFIQNTLGRVEDIVDWHERGTSWNIRIDSGDGLIYGGAHGVPLTWMHARVGDHCFTPRIGKPIEVNALWIASMRKWAALARAMHRASMADRFEALAKKANTGFERFWNEHYGWFADVLDTPVHEGYKPDLSLRPNQVVALALPGVDIPAARRERALLAVRENLLALPGLRGLSPRDPRYRPLYKGSPEERDAAYHNGPAWPWLLGFYAFAQQRANGTAAKAHIREVLSGVRPFYGRDCLRHLAEVYDGEYPFPSRGCPAQASSLALVLQALAEVHFGLTEIPH